MIRASLLGLWICTNTAINSHFTTLLSINYRHSPIGLYFYFNCIWHLLTSFLFQCVFVVSYIIKRIWYGMAWL